MNCKSCGVSIDGGYEYKDGYCFDCYKRLHKNVKQKTDVEITEDICGNSTAFPIGGILDALVCLIVGIVVVVPISPQVVTQFNTTGNMELFNNIAGVFLIFIMLIMIVGVLGIASSMRETAMV